MKMAYFVERPRRLEEVSPCPEGRECPYEIVAQIALAAIDYENFITDMRADRQFLEKAAGLCAEGGMMRCLLVTRRGRAGGVLVVPERQKYVRWAANLPA